MHIKILLLLILFNSSASATETSGGLWFGTFANKKLTDKYSGTIETQIRNNFDNGTVKQIVFRTGINYDYNDTHTFGALLGIMQTGTLIERRLMLQHQMKYITKTPHNLSHRLRLEGRNFQNSTNDAVRLRYRLLYAYDLNKAQQGLYWSEAFFNLSDESSSGQPTFERWRNFIGVRTKLLNTDAEIGYLNHAIYRKLENEIEHLAIVYWYL